ncbi:MAG: M23 family metallopeptidase [Acidimicrobiia bacterium]
MDVKEDVADDAHTRHLNYVVIEHDDGTAGFSAHLQHEGALVEIGDEVAQGQEIGLSGETGRTGGPVLRFGVYRTFPPIDDRDVPVVFSNSDGPFDARGGLHEAAFYRALSDGIGE